MNVIRGVTLAGLVMLGVCQSWGAVPTEVALDIRETRQIDFDEPLKSVESDKKDVAQVETREGDKAIRIEARNSGKALVTVVLKSGARHTIEVMVADDMEALLKYLRESLGGIIGIDPIRITDDHKSIVLSGTVRSAKDFKQYKLVIDKLPPHWKGKVIDRVLATITIPVEELKITLLAMPGLVNPSVKESGEEGAPAVDVSGKAFDLQTAKNAIARIRDELKIRNLDFVAVNDRIQVENCDFDVEFIFFSMSSEDAQMVGVDLLNALKLNLSFNLQETPINKSMADKFTVQGSVNLNNILNFLAQNNVGQIITRHSITVSNGKKGIANFGGNLVIRPVVAAGGVAAPQEVPYGFKVNVEPTLLSDKKISMVVNECSVTEFTYKDREKGDVDVSGPFVNTTIMMDEGSERVLTNFEKRYLNETLTGTPVLRKIPIIKYLFSRKSYTMSTMKAGLLVAVRAKSTDNKPIFQPLADDTDRVIEEIRKRLEKQNKP